jgi:hypothetical protein
LPACRPGLDKAGLLAEKQAAARSDAAFAKASTTTAAAPGRGVRWPSSPAAVVGQSRRSSSATTVNGLDALNDLSDATGASVENLSALEDIALRTGTSLETWQAMRSIKMNKALADAKPGTDAAEPPSRRST